MNRNMWNFIGALALVAMLGAAIVGGASAEGPWWMQEDGNEQRPWMDPNYECPADCPYDGESQARNFTDENDDGINDNAPMGRWNRDDATNDPRSNMRGYQSQNNFGGRMGGRMAQSIGRGQMPCQTGRNFGPGMMGRWNQDSDSFGLRQGMMGFRSQGCDGDCGFEPQSRDLADNTGPGRGSFGWMMQ